MNFSTLVSGEVLAGHLNDPDWRVFDCRHRFSDVEFGAQAYANGHLPGAFFLHLDRDLSSPTNGRNGRHPLPDALLLANKLGAAGVSRKTQVVAYDDDGGMIAARLWWLLRWLGHDRVALLDGGIGQWVKEGRTLTSEWSKRVPAVFEVEYRDWVVSSDEILASLDRLELCLVDARHEPHEPAAGKRIHAPVRP